MNTESRRRTDDQLEGMLRETCAWEVLGRNAILLCKGESLARAIERAEQLSDGGIRISALIRLPKHDVVVFQRQIDRLLQSASKDKAPRFKHQLEEFHRAAAGRGNSQWET